MFLVNIIVFLILATIYSQQNQDLQRMKNSKLKLVVEVFRHGARFPIYDVYDSSEQKENWEELTPVGMRQHFQLGQILRQEYIVERKFLPENYDHNLFFVVSTQYNRTIVSAQSQLQGLYPLTFGPQINQSILLDEQLSQNILKPPFESLSQQQPNPLQSNFALPSGFQPIPIMINNKILKGYSESQCQMQSNWISQNENSEDWKRIKSHFQKSIDEFCKIMQLDSQNTDFQDIQQYIDTFISDIYQNRKVVKELIENKELWKDLNLIYTILPHLQLYKKPLQKRTTITPFFNYLIQSFEDNINGKSTYKWHMNSAHDTTIEMIQQAMNFTSWQCLEKIKLQQPIPDGEQCIYTYPGFASNVIFELYEESNSQKFVMVRHNGTYFNICGQNSIYCEYQQFKNIVNNYVVEDYDLECQNFQRNNSNKQSQEETLPWVLVALFGTSNILLFLYILYIKKKFGLNLDEKSLQHVQLEENNA